MDNHYHDIQNTFAVGDFSFVPEAAPKIHPALIRFAGELLIEWNSNGGDIPAELVEEVLIARADLFYALREELPTEDLAQVYAEFTAKLPTLFMEKLSFGLRQNFPLY